METSMWDEMSNNDLKTLYEELLDAHEKDWENTVLATEIVNLEQYCENRGIKLD